MDFKRGQKSPLFIFIFVDKNAGSEAEDRGNSTS